MTATTYDTVVTHVRQEPVDNRFRYTVRQWLVDLDELPRLPKGLRWLASFEARDHIGGDTSIRRNIESFLAARGVDIAGGQVLMFATPRALGRAFNPISVHWCYAASGRLAAVVTEVHNTYGDRHGYLLRPSADGTVDATVDKQLYVSPFNPVDGLYRVTVSDPGERITVTVTLHRPGHEPFVATSQGHRRRSTSTVAAALGSAWTAWRVSALIHWQGLGLWRRGLRVEPRPVHARQEP